MAIFGKNGKILAIEPTARIRRKRPSTASRRQGGGSGWLTNDLENPYDLERFDQLESLGLVWDGMHWIPDGDGRFYQVRYKASFVGRAVVRKVAAWNRLERDKREWKKVHPFIGDPERVASAKRLSRDLAMLAMGALVSRAVDAAISMLP